MRPAFCHKTYHAIPGLKEAQDFPWPMNRTFPLGTESVGGHSRIKTNSTRLSNFATSSCTEHAFNDQESKIHKYEGHRFLSAMPTSRPKTRRFSMTYVALIASAILRYPEKRLTLSQIYQVIEKAFPEFTVSRAGWKNTVRHNLSLHECFVKGEVAANGKSCYWHIHPAYIARFSKGDFRKRPSRELCLFDDHTSLSRVDFDRTQTFAVPYAFGGANSLFPFTPTSQALCPVSANPALIPRVGKYTAAHSSTDWLREYKPYPYHYLFSPVNVALSSHHREKRCFAEQQPSSSSD